jgi:hypothetical protein
MNKRVKDATSGRKAQKALQAGSTFLRPSTLNFPYTIPFLEREDFSIQQNKS